MNKSTTNETVTVNGTKFSVTGRFRNGGAVYLAGARGGEHIMVRNVNSGTWYLLRNGVKRETVREISWQ